MEEKELEERAVSFKQQHACTKENKQGLEFRESKLTFTREKTCTFRSSSTASFVFMKYLI